MNKMEFKINHPSGIEITQNLKEINISKIFERNQSDIKSDWTWYDLPPEIISGKKISLTLKFYKGTLNEIIITLINSSLYGTSWNDWSETKEKKRVKHTREWLKSIGFNLGKYPWGEIWAEYDAKSGIGDGGVRYTP